jgi:hypothetical protein
VNARPDERDNPTTSLPARSAAGDIHNLHSNSQRPPFGGGATIVISFRARIDSRAR